MGLKLDLGCGKKPREGYVGVDVRDFGQEVVADLRAFPWKWADGSVEAIHSSHFVEHLEARDRVRFANEVWRVLEPGGAAEIIVPHWSSGRAYGDLTHAWPPVSEFWFYYLSRDWREKNAPHADEYECDFVCTWGFSIGDQETLLRNQAFQQWASARYRDVIDDVHATWRKPK